MSCLCRTTHPQVIIGCGDGKYMPGLLVALNGTTGAPLWNFSTSGTVASSPAIWPLDGTIVTATRDGWVHALTPTGGLLWTAAAAGAVYASPAIGPDGAVFLAGHVCSGPCALASHQRVCEPRGMQLMCETNCGWCRRWWLRVFAGGRLWSRGVQRQRGQQRVVVSRPRP
jgi:hypothetical protein